MTLTSALNANLCNQVQQINWITQKSMNNGILKVNVRGKIH